MTLECRWHCQFTVSHMVLLKLSYYCHHTLQVKHETSFDKKAFLEISDNWKGSDNDEHYTFIIKYC